MLQENDTFQNVYFSWFNVSDQKTIMALEPGDGSWVVKDGYTLWLSPTFGDRYSAKNWVFVRLRRVLSLGLPITCFDARVFFPNFYRVEERQVEPGEVCRHLGRYAVDTGLPLITQRKQIQYDPMLEQLDFANKAKKLVGIFKYPFLIDAYCDDIDELGIKYQRLGPAEPVFRLAPSVSLPLIQDDTKRCVDFALTHREWTIPDGAAVDLRSTSYSMVQMDEYEDYVSFIFREDERYFMTALDLSTKSWLDEALTIYRGDDPVPEELLDEHRTAIHYVCALLLHDFWVTDYRERNQVLNPNRPLLSKDKLPWLKRPADNRPLIYRPHIRYIDNLLPYTRDKMSEFLRSVVDRRAHFRNLRGKRKPSMFQLLLAQNYGLSTPKGHTFVRPVGEWAIPDSIKVAADDAVYRCTSALRALVNAQVFENNRVRVEWEQFEEDVRAWLQDAGLTILKPSWTKKGDGGIDVIAVRRDAGQSEVYCVQCKCWRADRKVGIGVIREFDTAVQRFTSLYDEIPSTVRKLVITTAQFSDGSDFWEEVDRLGIILVDGKAFCERDFTALGSKRRAP